MNDQHVPDRAEADYLIGQVLRDLLRLAPDVNAALAHRVGVGVSDVMALDYLTAEPDPLGVVDLAHRLGMRSASATVLVDRLVAAGHVTRHAHPTDGRRTALHATDHAREEARAALAPLIRDINAVTADLDEQTAMQVLTFLTRVCAVLARFADTESPGRDESQPG